MTKPLVIKFSDSIDSPPVAWKNFIVSLEKKYSRSNGFYPHELDRELAPYGAKCYTSTGTIEFDNESGYSLFVMKYSGSSE